MDSDVRRKTGAATNLTWGDSDWSTLYYTTRHTLGRIRMTVAGIPIPRGDV